MARDSHDVLGLRPGGYSSRELTRRYQTRRAQLLAQLDDPGARSNTIRDLDDLHIAYQDLRRRVGTPVTVTVEHGPPDRSAELRNYIAASLEDGLLRYSRRQLVMERAAELGLSEFQAHLLIAQVQFGDDQLVPVRGMMAGIRRHESPRVWARFTAVGIVALAMFLGMVHWFGV